jgi:pre-rRNA-processing protein TSR3
VNDPEPNAPRDLLVLRDPRESWKRCSLRPLRGLPGVRFVTWRDDLALDVGDRLLLDPAAPPLADADRGRALFVIDCSWRRLPLLRRAVVGEPRARSLPPLLTAYPRRSETFADPAAGLATVEALYAAGLLLGEPDPQLLEGYRFKDEFLARNAALFTGSGAGQFAGPR